MDASLWCTRYPAGGFGGGVWSSNAHINVFLFFSVNFDRKAFRLCLWNVLRISFFYLMEGLYVKSVRGFKLEQIRRKLNDFSESEGGSKHWSPKIAAAAILLGPKRLRVLRNSQCDITRHGLSDGSLRILELLGGMYSTYFWFMSYIPPINNKLGPINMAPMASKAWALKQYVARSSLLLRSVGQNR